MRELKHTALVLLICLSFLFAALTGCGSSSYSSAEDGGQAKTAGADEAATDFAYDGADYAAEDTDTADTAATGSDEASSENDTVQSNQKLVRTVDMSVETTAYDAMLEKIKDKVSSLGGYTEYSTSSGNEDSSSRYASMTLRIPADKLDSFLEKIKAESNVLSMTENVEDVTLQYVDTEARIKSLKTEQETLLDLLAKAEDVDTILTIQNQLTQVRYQIESYQSQIKVMDNQVDYSTVTISVSEVETITPTEEKGFFEQIAYDFKESLHLVFDGVRGFLIWFFGRLPILIVWALIIALIIMAAGKLKKHINSKKTEKKEPAKRKKYFLNKKKENEILSASVNEKVEAGPQEEEK